MIKLGIIHGRRNIYKFVKHTTLPKNLLSNIEEDVFINTRIDIYPEKNINYEISTKFFLYFNDTDYSFALIEKVHSMKKESWNYYYRMKIRSQGLKFYKSLEEALNFLNKEYKIEINPNFKDEFISNILLEELRNENYS